MAIEPAGGNIGTAGPGRLRRRLTLAPDASEPCEQLRELPLRFATAKSGEGFTRLFAVAASAAGSPRGKPSVKSCPSGRSRRNRCARQRSQAALVPGDIRTDMSCR